MTNEIFALADAANTPLTMEEQEQLIPSYISRRRELNEAEQENIANGARWAASQRQDILTQAFLKKLHKKMFGQVWKWAGQYRKSPRNIGVEAYRIHIDLQQVLNDVRFWMENATYGVDEIAIRYSHRVVAIHPFPNGNGRLSRLLADILAHRLGGIPFTWGRSRLTSPSVTRDLYIAALKKADQHDIVPLIIFSRS